MRQAIAFCPGHITGFFQICRHPDMLQTGSRGGGFSITLGAESRVVLKDGDGQVDVHINGARVKAIVTEAAVRNVLGDERCDVDVYTLLQLPVSQGFGMSAAGALSSALALSELLGRGEDDAYEAAHRAEVQCGTGLGDVAALRTGGIEFRRKEGLQPFGEVERIPGDFDMLLAKVGPMIDTSTIILDPVRSEAINKAGSDAYQRFSRSPGLHELLDVSMDFTRSSGLITGHVEKALRSVGAENIGGMCMVGNSIFAAGGDIMELGRKLSKYGNVYEASVDLEGPRLI
ncbi:MAG TPA: pantothenate kinase [Methanomassiliicoccales archaeon]|nr:pantothenate kinase [Methanomassiliicoccales archaeon]